MSKQSGNNWDVEKLLSQGYKSGSIVRVKMLNFLTYDECEVFPGPKLNVVIGPNGTGKSTLTHAICLACCGSTGDVGRSSDLAKFVKHGKEGQESYAEVDILTQDKVTNIRRTINSDNKGSKWSLDRKVTTQASIKEIMNKYSIDVDNLCSFMPQDKVGNFSRYTPAQILEHTLKSISVLTASEKNLYTEQQELSNMEKAKGELRRDKEAKKQTYQRLEEECRNMESEIEKLKRRETAKETLEYCKIKFAKLELEELQEATRREQDRVTEAQNRLDTEAVKVEPLETQLRDLQREQALKNKACDSVTRDNAKLEHSLKTCREKTDLVEEDLETAASNLQSVEVNRKRLEGSLVAAQQELQREEAKLSQSKEQLPRIQKDIAANNATMGAVQESLFQTNEQLKGVDDKMKNVYNQINAMTREVTNLQDPRQVYKNHLQRLTSSGPNGGRNFDEKLIRDTVLAMDLMDRNEQGWRDNRRLTGNVYGPVALHCDVPDKACAAMIEKVVPINKLLSWVVENDADGDFLKDELRIRGGLGIDVITIKNIDRVLNLNRPYGPDAVRRMQGDLGLSGYLSDQITCPDSIRALMYSFHALHTVLWGRHTPQNKPRQSMDLNLLCPQGVNMFKLYIHDTTVNGGRAGGMEITEYSGRKSRYGQHLPPSTSIVNISGKNVFHSQKGGDGGDVQERKATLDNNISVLRAQQSDGNKEINHLRTLVGAKEKELGQLRSEKMNLMNLQKAPDSCAANVKKIKQKVAELEKRVSMDFETEKRTRQFEYRKVFDLYLGSIEATVKAAKALSEFSVEKSVVLKNKNALLEAMRDLEAAITEKLAELKTFERELKEAKSIHKQKQKEEEACEAKLIKKAKELAPEIADEDDCVEHFVNVIFPKAVQTIPENTVGELTARMAQLNAEISNSVENPNLLRRFDKCKAEMQQLQVELEQARDNFANAENGLQDRAEEWLRAVKNIANKLNTHFSKYMQDLSFDGEVKLRETDNYCDYQMVMRVRFRDDSELTELSGTRHSGGERAVSTVMYLMALQDMTSSPFRVVDEINQGMDERNERLVFDRIVKSCCGDPDRPQYFLVSPKLLQGLRAIDNPDVTALIVLNGPGVKAKYLFSELLQAQMRIRGLELPQVPRRDALAGQKRPVGAVVKSEKVNGTSSSAGGRSYKRGRVADMETQEMPSDEDEDF